MVTTTIYLAPTMSATMSATRTLATGLRALTLSSTGASTSTASSVAVRHASTSSSGASSYERSRVPRLPPVAPLPSRLKPTSPAYFTGRPAYIDTLLELEELTRQTKRALEQAHLIAPNAAPPSLASTGASASRANLWVNTEQLQLVLNTNLKAAQYRQIVSRLSLLARYASLVTHLESRPELHHVLGGDNVIQRFHTTLERFMNENAKTNNLLAEKDADRALWTASERKVDRQGRAYSRGRRKESSAQAWLIRAKPDTFGQILVNNMPIADYFTRTAERETVTWPLKLTSTLGTYNVFALARGGGKSGQAGAIAHAVANAIVAETAHGLEFEQGIRLKKYARDVLAKDGVLKRDPRMVERKKTGLAKARKAFTWVKR